MCEVDRQESAISLRKTLWKCIGGYLIVGMPISIYISNAMGRPLLPGLCAFALIFTYLPLTLMVMTWIRRYRRTPYEIGANGVLRQKGGYYKWRSVEAYNFSDSDAYPGVRVLSLKVSFFDCWMEVPYSKNDVEEQDLLAVLHRFAPDTQERQDNKSTPAELDKIRLSCIRQLYVFGILTGALGIGSAISIVELCNMNSHGLFVSMSFQIIFLFVLCAACFAAGTQRYVRTIKQMAGQKEYKVDG
jgi:hypothetical protein